MPSGSETQETVEALAQLRDALARRVLARADRHRSGGADAGLTTAQHVSLSVVAEGPIGPSDLAMRQGVAVSTATRMLHGLEKAGLVGPAPRGHDDRRRRSMEITPEGRRALEDADAELRRRISAVVDLLDADERRAVGEGAEAIRRALARIDPAAP